MNTRARTIITTLATLALAAASYAKGPTLVVEVKATPHPDAKRPAKDPYTGKSDADKYGLERVDYKKLDEIVVYAEPIIAQGENVPAAALLPLAVEVEGRPMNLGEHAPLAATGVRAKLQIKNTTSTPQTYYCVTEGSAFEFTSVPPGESRETTLNTPGLIEIMAESSDDPIARVFVAPTPWVQLAKSGDDITFEGLPPTKCKVTTWHPRLPGTTHEVALKDNKRTKIEATVGMRDADLPKPN